MIKATDAMRLNPECFCFVTVIVCNKEVTCESLGREPNANQTTSQLVLNGLHHTPVCMGTMLLGAVSALSSFCPGLGCDAETDPEERAQKIPPLRLYTLHFCFKRKESVSELGKGMRSKWLAKLTSVVFATAIMNVKREVWKIPELFLLEACD